MSESILEWISYISRNKTQQSALIGGFFLLVFSGQHLCWGIFNINFDSEAKFVSLFGMNDVFFWMVWLVIAWFAAGCFGVYVSAKLVLSINKLKIYVSFEFLTKLKRFQKKILGDLLRSFRCQCYSVHIFQQLGTNAAACKSFRRIVAWNCLRHVSDSRG